MALPRKTPNRVYMTLTDNEKLILDTLGNGKDHAGMKIAIAWAGHFYNLGLDPDASLDHVGLCTYNLDNAD
jgi:hypothetical protein